MAATLEADLEDLRELDRLQDALDRARDLVEGRLLEAAVRAVEEERRANDEHHPSRCTSCGWSFDALNDDLSATIRSSCSWCDTWTAHVAADRMRKELGE